LEFISYDNNIYCFDDVTPLFDLEGVSKKGAGFLVAVNRVLKLIFITVMREFGSQLNNF